MANQNSTYARPMVDEVYNLLCQRSALIVHFSGAPKGAGAVRKDHLFPNDLLHVINMKATGGVSSSVVLPNDNFHGVNRNATGCIGVILGLKGRESLEDANCEDCGSIEDEHGNRNSCNPRDISLDELERTITERPIGKYNEWIVKNYKVLGIFAKIPIEISKLVFLDYSEDVPENIKATDPVLDTVTVRLNEFPNEFFKLPIYTFDAGELKKKKGDRFVSVNSDEIYSLSYSAGT